MRVATYNIENGRAVKSSWHGISPARIPDYFRKKEDMLHRIGAFLAREQVDVALLQEVDGGSPFTRGKPQLPVVREAGGYAHQWYISCDNSFGLIHQGNGILANANQEPLDEVAKYALPGGIETRGALEVRLTLDGTPVSFITTHLSIPRMLGPLSTAHRKEQFDFLAALVRFFHEDRPVVLGGDLNTLDYGEVRLFMDASGLYDPFPPDKRTYHSLRPERNLDHLLLSEGLGARNPRVVNGEILSDHLPVMADVYAR